MNLVLHPNTETAIKRYLGKPGHALLIEAADGAGKGALAAYIASCLLGTEVNRLSRQPFFQIVRPIDGTISIDAIRAIQRFMRLKTIGSSHSIRRVLVLENAELLTIEAQNAFLKLLEEPPADTVIILTVVNQSMLLPTIRSRVQIVRLNAPSPADLEKHFTGHGFKTSDIVKAYHISEGQAGLMQALLSDDTEHPLVSQIQVAKKLLSSSIFDRLIVVDQLSKHRADCEQLLKALQLVCHAALTQAVERGKDETVKRWHRSMAKLTQAQQSFTSNPNLKLLLTDLLLGL